MGHTFDEAYTIVTDHLIAKWNADVPALVGKVAPELRFQDVQDSKPFKDTGGRFVMDSVSNPQTSLRNAEHGQRYTNYGIIIVQLFVLREGVKSGKTMRLFGEYIKGVFRDPAFPGCFIFQNIRVNRLEPEPNLLRTNVIVDYQFDELV